MLSKFRQCQCVSEGTPASLRSENRKSLALLLKHLVRLSDPYQSENFVLSLSSFLGEVANMHGTAPRFLALFLCLSASLEAASEVLTRWYKILIASSLRLRWEGILGSSSRIMGKVAKRLSIALLGRGSPLPATTPHTPHL